jgi:hypothetical protein
VSNVAESVVFALQGSSYIGRVVAKIQPDQANFPASNSICDAFNTLWTGKNGQDRADYRLIPPCCSDIARLPQREAEIMRTLFSLLGLVVALTSATAQSEVLFSRDTRDSIRGEGPPAAPLEVLPESNVYPANPWSVDLLLGIETGLRIKRFLNAEKGQGWMAEGFVGLDYVIFPAAGVGLRYGIVPWMGRHNAVSVSPGVDAHVLANPFHGSDGWVSGGPSGFGLITADVDLSWRHLYPDSFSGEVGLKLGAGATIGKVRHVAVPIVSVYAGFRF